MKKIILVILLIMMSTLAFATSGRTDSNGGHHTSQCDHARGICYYHRH